MDVDMDIDIDYVEVNAVQTEGTGEIKDTTIITTTDLQDGPAAYREDNLEPQYPCLDKVHIRGLDDLNHDEIKAYAREHYPSQEPSRIEWIDDTSANFVYPTEETAAEALQAFTSDTSFSYDTTRLQKAKPTSSRPHASLLVRMATTHDVKQRGAHEASRFYLLNPEYDPRERRKQYDSRRGRGRDERGSKRRRSEPEPMQFDASMYDDPPITDTDSNSHTSDRTAKRRRFEGSRDDLFADRFSKSAGRLRDRSASPSRLANGDGRFGFNSADAGYESSSRPSYMGQRSHNAGKELMSLPAANARSFLRDSSPAPRELFPNHRSPDRESNAGKELFANGTGVGSPYHRRTDAFDAKDEAGSSPQGSPPLRAKSRNLEDRITGGPLLRSGGLDKSRRNVSLSQPLNPGFSIRGAAKETNARVKELFPEKVGDNSGKELFAGRRTERRRAEDLFG